ncbi:hypothetical protein Pse7429DRAFT_1939 [Pseudanabaena biceps PCC 7429]|uniref:Uncharacterized protein n=1 Tax=Pseudanabaena biceps PCC 7429 TaxID=927668 RepID=L8N3U3_9CYAN|nr:hypothetical protein Pse7429DRAFT_1939 [Pseudanabaena biceps PCC 7429]
MAYSLSLTLKDLDTQKVRTGSTKLPNPYFKIAPSKSLTK